MTKIPILDLSLEIDVLKNELMKAIEEVLESTHFISGPNVIKFENEIQNYFGVKHAIGVNSGTDALVIGLHSLDIQGGDEVITTAFTFFATAEAISQVGATPVFVDIDPYTYNLNPQEIEKKITSRTKAILPVHLYGHSVDMDPLIEIANNYGLRILEDVAQACGGDYKNTKLGSLGDIGALSFFPSKNLGAFGDGGMILTNNDEIAEICRMLRSHGAKKKYYNERIGYNSRLDELQAAILRVKLPYLKEWNEKRNSAAKYYKEILGDLKEVVLPTEMPQANHVYHQYTIRLPKIIRDDIQRNFSESGINTMIYYPVPVHQLPIYKPLNYSLPLAEQAAQEVLSLPIGPLISRENQDDIASVLKNAINQIC